MKLSIKNLLKYHPHDVFIFSLIILAVIALWSFVLMFSETASMTSNKAFLSLRDDNQLEDINMEQPVENLQDVYKHQLLQMGVKQATGIGPDGYPPPKERLVHLDLKGAPPKIEYLIRILPILKSLGATGLLIEYEDMFPFTGRLANISAKNAYNQRELMHFLNAVSAHELKVMPLIQTFGHMEYALKIKDFDKVREVANSPQSICPSMDESHTLIQEMLTQLIEFHLNSGLNTNSILFSHIHIGCDEVYTMGQCNRCKYTPRDSLFIRHVNRVASFVHTKWSQLKVVIWDDMLRHISIADLKDSKLGNLVEPMVWVYADDIYYFVTNGVWSVYEEIFDTVWTASAFKGANGESIIIPPARQRLDNHIHWLYTMQMEGPQFKNGIQGIALTGWQRYDHFAVLCELLPTSMPSLALCLSTVSRGYFETDPLKNTMLSSLTCASRNTNSIKSHPWIHLNSDPDLLGLSNCLFPGSVVFRYAIRLRSAVNDTIRYIHDLKYNRGWLTEYNIRHNFSSPLRLDDVSDEVQRYIGLLQTLQHNAYESMEEVFDKWTIKEFVEQHIDPLMRQLLQIYKDIERLRTVKHWPRRPLPELENETPNNETE